MTFPRHNSFLACWLWFMATGHLGAPTEALRGGGSPNVSTSEKCGLQSQKGNPKNTTSVELPRFRGLELLNLQFESSWADQSEG